MPGTLGLTRSGVLTAPRRRAATFLAPICPDQLVALSRSFDGEASCSGKEHPEQSSGSNLFLSVNSTSRLAKTMAATVCVYQLAFGMHSARASEERSWKPRRHMRRMDERFSDSWADELAEVRIHRHMFAVSHRLSQCRHSFSLLA